MKTTGNERGRRGTGLVGALGLFVAILAALLGGAADAGIVGYNGVVASTANTYLPGVVVIQAGADLTYVNTDAAMHSVTAIQQIPGSQKPLFDSGLLAATESALVARTAHLAPNASGYEFYCTMHQTMRGTLIVL